MLFILISRAGADTYQQIDNPSGSDNTYLRTGSQPLVSCYEDSERYRENENPAKHPPHHLFLLFRRRLWLRGVISLRLRFVLCALTPFFKRVSGAFGVIDLKVLHFIIYQKLCTTIFAKCCADCVNLGRGVYCMKCKRIKNGYKDLFVDAAPVQAKPPVASKK